MLPQTPVCELAVSALLQAAGQVGSAPPGSHSGPRTREQPPSGTDWSHGGGAGVPDARAELHGSPKTTLPPGARGSAKPHGVETTRG